MKKRHQPGRPQESDSGRLQTLFYYAIPSGLDCICFWYKWEIISSKRHLHIDIKSVKVDHNGNLYCEYQLRPQKHIQNRICVQICNIERKGCPSFFFFFLADGVCSWRASALCLQFPLGLLVVFGSVHAMLMQKQLTSSPPAQIDLNGRLTWSWLTKLNHGTTWMKSSEYRELRAAMPCR